MRSRFLARLTDIAFQASPPRGVGMLRLVSPSAISRYGLPRIASRTGFPRQKRMGVQAAARLESHVIQITMNASESPAIMEIGITGGIFFSLQPRQQRASDDGTTRQRSVSSRFAIMTVKRCKLAPRLYRPCSGSDRAADREPRRNLPAAHHSGRALDQRHGLSAWLRSASIAAAR